MRRVLTYGTFDLLHWGHIRLLKRARALGDYLIVGLSTDEFHTSKLGKKQAYHSFQTRQIMLEAVRYVDLVVPEQSWDQKLNDVKLYGVDTVVMGSDWTGSARFEYLRDHCDVVYLPRTEGTSTSQIRRDLLVEAVSPNNRVGAPGAPALQDIPHAEPEPAGTHIPALQHSV